MHGSHYRFLQSREQAGAIEPSRIAFSAYTLRTFKQCNALVDAYAPLAPAHSATAIARARSAGNLASHSRNSMSFDDRGFGNLLEDGDQ